MRSKGGRDDGRNSGGLCIVFGISGEPSEQSSNEILINDVHLQRLVEAWKLILRGPQMQQELTDVIGDQITEEVHYLEALLPEGKSVTQ